MALVVLGLLVFRAVTRRADLLLTLADATVQIAELFDRTLGDAVWYRGRRAAFYGRTRRSRLWFRLERLTMKASMPFFRLAWALEGLALGRFHAHRGFGLSAASGIRDYDYEDDLEYGEYDDEAYYDYDPRYDY